MKTSNLVAFGFVVCALGAPSTSLAKPPPVTNITLQNPVLSAGDRFDLHFTAEPGAKLNLVSGFSVYLGHVVQNVFDGNQSESLNRQMRQLTPTTFEVVDLKVNRWVVPRQDRYTFEEIDFVNDRGTYEQYAAGRDGFYYYGDTDQHQWIKTQIPVISFHVNDNPIGDIQPPTITALSVTKTDFRLGESPTFYFSASDAVSGVDDGGFSSYPLFQVALASNSTTAITRQIAPGQYSSSDIILDRPYDLPADGDVRVSGFMIRDRAGNWSQIMAEPGDRYYSTLDGQSTAIEVIHLHVMP